MRQQMIILALATSLGACAITPEPTGQWTRWVCDSQVEVYWRPDSAVEQGVEVRLGAGDMLYHLKQEPSGSGELYSDGVLGFHRKGEQGLVYWVANDDLIGRGCKAPAN